MQYIFFGLKLNYKVDFEVASIFFLIVMLIFMWMQYADSFGSTKSFRRLLGILIAANIIDIFTAICISYLECIPDWVCILVLLMNGLMLVLLMYFYVIYIRSFCKRYYDRINEMVTNIVTALYVLLMIVNLFTGIQFSVRNDQFERGPLYYSVVAYSLFMIFDALYIGLKNFKFINRRQKIAIIIFTLFELLGSIIQSIALPNMRIGLFADTMAFVVIMFALETPDYKKLEVAMEQLRASSEMLMKAKADAEEARREAEEANLAKSSFLASMSHEIRTPINGVLGMNSIILKESTDPKIIEYARNVDNAGNGLLSLINDILDLSKIESGKMEIVPVEYELSDVLSECYNMVFMRAGDKHLDLSFENNKTIPNRLIGDEVRIRQIITNLLTNAIKYTEEGMVLLTADWESIDEQNMNLIISVKDTGIGIKKDDLSKLFLEYQRVNERRNRNIEGTGLGLKITKQFLDIMGGSITVESVVGKGSEFVVRIPQKLSNRFEEIGNFSSYVHISTNAEKSSFSRFVCPTGRILVVDDVDMNLKVVKGLLKDTGLTVDMATSGEECLSMIKTSNYDLILMDHMMPDMDGIETFERMKSMPEVFDSSTPVIMVTANVIRGVKEEYLSTGFADYLSKPIREEDLNQMLIKYLPKDKVTLKAVKQDSDSTQTENALIDEDVPEKELSDFERRFSFLDIRTGMTFCLENEEFYESIIREFKNTSKFEDIQDAYDNADLNLYTTLVHGIKSSAMTIGAVEVSREAQALEFAAKSDDVDYLKEHHYDFMKRYGALLDKLDEVYGTY